MKRKSPQLLAALASSLLVLSAAAAEPCKAYVKFDGGYGMSSNAKLNADSTVLQDKSDANTKFFAGTTNGDTLLSKQSRGMIGSAGVGYAFNDAMRAEVSFNFAPKMKSETERFSIETRELGGSAKLAYDFNNNTAVTPFVFAEVGAMNIRPEIKVNPNMKATAANDIFALTEIAKWDAAYGENGTSKQYLSKPVSSSKQKSKTALVYKGGFGLSFKASDQVNVDLTYGVGSRASYVLMSNLGSGDVGKESDKMPIQAVDFKNSKGFNAIKEGKIKSQVDQSLTIGVRFTM